MFYLERTSLIVCFLFCMYLPSFAYGKEVIPAIWNVQNTNEYYVGRTSLLNNTHNAFTSGKREIAIVGSAGIGKTQLAKKYAEAYRSDYDVIWWLDVGKDLGEQYQRLVHEWNRTYAAKQINTYLPKDEIIRHIKDHLRTTDKNWLLIFDNVADRNQISNYIPDRHNSKSLGHVLITSKNPYTWSHVMKLEKFTRAESIELLQKITNEKDISSIDKLAEVLGDYPLAIVQAASYIKSHPGLNAREYTLLFINNREKLWAEEGKSKHTAFDNYEYTVFATLSLIVAEIKKESPEAYELLVFCSYLNSKNIPELLLKQYATEILKADTLVFRESLSIFGKYSLINQNKSKDLKAADDETTFTMHELAQLTVHDMLSKDEKKTYLKKELIVTANFLPHKLDIFVPYLIQHSYLVANMESIVNSAIALEIYNNDLLTIEQRCLEYTLSGKRDFLNAEKSIAKIDQLINKVPQPDPIVKAKLAIMKSAFQAWYILDYHKSLQYALEALEIAAKNQINTEDTLRVYNRLSQTYNLLGDNDNALIYAKQGDNLVKEDPTLGNQDALYQGLAKAFADNGDLTSALGYADKAVGQVATKNGKMGAGDIPTYATKAMILIKMKKYEEAFEFLNTLHESANKIFGQNEHTHKAIVNCYYGYTLFIFKNEMVKAKNLILQSQDTLTRLFGKSGKRTRSMAATHRYLGEIYEKEGNNAKAQAEYANALEITINSYNGNSPATDDLGDLYTRLAIINAKLEEPATAQYYLDLHCKTFGSKHPRTKEIINYFNEIKMAVGF